METRLQVTPFTDKKFWAAGRPITVSGTLDTLYRDTTSGRIWIEDHKTTSISAPDRASCLFFDSQVFLYKLLTEATYENTVFGVRHNIIRKPTIRLRKGETYGDYLERCHDWYTEQFAQGPSNAPLVQSCVGFPAKSSPQYKTRMEEMGWLVRRWGAAMTAAVTLERWPRVGSSYHGCHNKYGQACPYQALCHAPPQAWYDILATNGFTKTTTLTNGEQITTDIYHTPQTEE